MLRELVAVFVDYGRIIYCSRAVTGESWNGPMFIGALESYESRKTTKCRNMSTFAAKVLKIVPSAPLTLERLSG
jgi:hypothetical protein